METRALAQLLASVRFADLDEQTTDKAKMCVLDALGVAYAGSRERSSQILKRTLLEDAPCGSSILLDGSAEKTGVSAAAAINAGYIHAQDFDDLHNSSIVHPAVITIPTALALGQQLGASGQRFLLSVVLGYDVAARLGEAINPASYYYWHTTAVVGPFAAAAAASVLLGLNEEQAANALGSAGTQAGGLWAFLAEGAMSKLLHVANANICGIRAARLAMNGFTGATNIIESPRGFVRALSKEPHLERVTKDLGSPFKIMGDSFKPYGCCRHTHSACYGIYTFREKYGITAQDVEKIEDYTYSTAFQLTNDPAPANSYAAKFSLQYCIAAALLLDDLHESGFSSERLADPALQELMGKVEVSVSDDLDRLYREDSDQWAHRLVVRLKNGTVIEDTFIYPFGDFNNPFTWEDAQDKFMLLTEPVIGESRALRLCENVRSIDKMADIGQLFG